MMMAPDRKKKIVSIVLGKLRGEGAPQPDESTEEQLPGPEVAFKKLADALKNGDAAMGVAALKEFMTLCESDEEGAAE